MPFDLPSLRETYARDGVVLLPRALDETALADGARRLGVEPGQSRPRRDASPRPPEATFYNDLYNPRCLEGYAADAAGLADPGADRRHLGRARRLVHVRAGVPEGGRRGAAHAVAPGQLLPDHRRRAPGGGLDLLRRARSAETRWSSSAARTAACSTTARASIRTTTPRRSTPARRCRACRTSRPTARRLGHRRLRRRARRRRALPPLDAARRRADPPGQRAPHADPALLRRRRDLRRTSRPRRPPHGRLSQGLKTGDPSATPLPETSVVSHPAHPREAG